MTLRTEGQQSASVIVSKKELAQLVPYCSQHILRLEKQGKFPRRIQIGPRRVGWLLSAIQDWIAGLPVGPPPAPAMKKRSDEETLSEEKQS